MLFKYNEYRLNLVMNTNTNESAVLFSHTTEQLSDVRIPIFMCSRIEYTESQPGVQPGVGWDNLFQIQKFMT